MPCCAVACCVDVQGHLEEMVTNKHAHRVLMQLLAPDSHRYLPPAIYEIMHPPAKTTMVAAAAAAAGSGGAAAGLDEDEEEPDFGAADAPDADTDADSDDADGDEQLQEEDSGDEAGASGSVSEGGEEPAGISDSQGGQGPAGQQAGGSGDAALVARQLGESKKDPGLRRQELLGSGPDSLAAGLVGLCAEQAVQLLASPVGSEVLVEVARGAAGGLLWQQHQAGVQAVHQAILQQLQQDVAALSSGGGKQQQTKKGKKSSKAGSSGDAAGNTAEPLLTHYYGSRALRRLLLPAGSSGAEGAAARAFAERLWCEVLQGQCASLVGGHAEKVLAGLLHCDVQPVVQAASSELQPLLKGVDAQKWAAKFLGPPAGQQQQWGDKQHQQQQQQSHPKKKTKKQQC